MQKKKGERSTAGAKRAFLLAFGIIFLVILLINVLTPYLADDYLTLRHFFFSDRSRTVSSFFDALESSFQYYLTWGGRFFAYLLFTGLGFLPPFAVDILNTLAYFALTWIMYDIIRGDNRHNLVLYLSIHVLLWVCVPDYGQIMFWMCGAANYLYMIIPVLLVIRLFRRKIQNNQNSEKTESVWSLLLYGLLGFLAGAAMEQISAGMLVILTLYFVYARFSSIRCAKVLILAYICSLLGYGFCFFAPGNFKRAALEVAYPFFIKLGAAGYYMVLVLWIPAVLFLLGLAAMRPEDRMRVGGEAGIYMIAAIISAFILVITPSVPERGFFVVGVFGILGAGIACAELLENALLHSRRLVCIVCAGACIFVLAQAADTMLASYDITRQTKSREALILSEREKGNLDISVPVMEMNYPLKAKHDGLTGLYDLAVDPGFWVNTGVAEYYHVHTITGILSSEPKVF